MRRRVVADPVGPGRRRPGSTGDPRESMIPGMGTRARIIHRPRGSAAVMAMVFLVLFTCLAIGFFYSVTTSVQIANNERSAAQAQLAAESGLQFLRYQLATLDIPPNTADNAMAAEVAGDLTAKLGNTANLGANASITRNGNVITIPSITTDANDAGSSFTSQLEWVPVASPGTSYLRASVTGRYGAAATEISRTVRLDYGIQAKSTTLFNYGIASKGAVTIKNSVQTKVLGTPDSDASILSASTAATSITTGSGTIDGNLTVVVAKSQVNLGGGSVGGASNSLVIREDHVNVAPPPNFPVVDTTPFKALATNVYLSDLPYQKNVRVPPNTNPRFNGGDVIEGILYIESPNTVTFRGHATIAGAIVFENKNGVAENVLDFRGNVFPGAIPLTPEFAAVRAATAGWAILAPAASLTMSGSVDGFVEGSIMARKVEFNGSADVTFTNGSVISLGEDATDIGGKTLHFKGTGADNPPTTGLTFSGSFRPDPRTYHESN